MYIRRLVPSLMLVAGGYLAAADATAPIATAAPAGTQAEVRADLERLRREALVTKPTSIFSDPDAAKALAHLRSQLLEAQQQDHNMPPGLQLAEDARSVMFGFGMHDSTALDQNEQKLVVAGCLLDAGTSAEALLMWMEARASEMGEAKPTTAGAYTGWKTDEVFIGNAGSIFTLASPTIYNEWPERAGLVDAPATVIGVNVDLAPYLRALSALIASDPQAEERLLLKFFPELANGSPHLTASITVAGGWKGLVRLTGCGQLPMAKTINPTIAARLGDRDASLTLGFDPQIISDRLVNMAASESNQTADEIRAQADEKLAEVGVTLDQVSGIFSGTIAIGVTWRNGPIPNVLGVIGLRDSASLAKILQTIAGQVGGEATTIDGAISAWTFSQLPVPVTVIVGKDVLAISQDPTLATNALAAPAAQAAVIANEVAALEISKSLMEIGLKTGWNQIIAIDEKLGRDPRNEVQSLAYFCGEALTVQDATVALPATFSLLTGDQKEGLDNSFTSIHNVVAPTLDETGLVFGDTHFAAYVGPATDDNQNIACTVIWREADGFWSFDREHYRTARLDAAALAQLQIDQPRRIGLDPADLPVLDFPSVPTINAKCFPPLATILRHLPDSYRLSIANTPDALEVHEQGLPVVTSMLGTLAMMSPIAIMETNRHRLRHEQEMREEALHEKHSALFASLEAAGKAVQRARDENKELPIKVSGLVGDEFGLTLEDCAGFFAGTTPTAATALDSIGIWRPIKPDDVESEWIWRIQVEPGMSLLLFPWGNVEFMEDANIK